MSVGLYVHNTIIYKCYSNLRIPSIADCSFKQYVSQTVLYPNIQEALQDIAISIVTSIAISIAISSTKR